MHAIVETDESHPDPAMLCYQSDGWGALVATTEQQKVGKTAFVRKGRIKHEFLLERSVYKTIDANDKISGALMLFVPRPMLHGVKCWNIFQASCERAPMLRTWGHRGLVISWYVQDGLHAQGFLRHHFARHRLLYEDAEFEADEDHRFLFSNMDLVLGWECTLHVASRALKWGQMRLSSEDILKDLHLSIKGLRNASATIRAYVKPFLLRHMRFDFDNTCDWDA